MQGYTWRELFVHIPNTESYNSAIWNLFLMLIGILLADSPAVS